MSATVIGSGLQAGHGNRTLFTGLDVVVAPGDVLGLVGANGAGKSTLLQILAGLREPDAGSVVRSPADASIGYLPQDRTGLPGETVTQLLARRTGVAAADAELTAATEALAAPALAAAPAAQEQAVQQRYATALESWLALGAADFTERLAAVAQQVGLDLGAGIGTGAGTEAGWDQPVQSLSGGQAARVGLMSLLLSRFDVLLLDEPTNDLDMVGLAQLETFIAGASTAMVIVSHDREFLDRTVTGVLELDLAQQRVRAVNGSYQAYLIEREVERTHERAEYEQYADRRQSLQTRAHTQRAWMEKGVANARRKAPDGDKIGRKFRAESTEKQAAKARQTERLIERLEEVSEPRKEWQLRMEIAAAPRSGAVSAVASQAVVHRGGFSLGPVDLQIDWADRVAITGPNGSGKSTLLSMLLGKIELSAGTATLGPGVVVGEVDQARAVLDVEVALVNAVGAELPHLDDAAVRTLLAKFGLRADAVARLAATLSPGEQTRAALALLQARGINLLVLDEPTNHLDIAAIEQLESALQSFAGTVLLVTHDRKMLENVTITRRLEVARGMVTEL